MIDFSQYRPLTFSSCENPYNIKDDKGRTQTVRCGVCDSCKQSSRNRSSSLLQLEVQNWKYGIFFTLTYSNHWLPTVHTYKGPDGFIHMQPNKRMCDRLKYYPQIANYDYKLIDGEYIAQLDSFVDNDKVYIPPISNYSRKSDFGVLFYPDVQLFKKKFIKSYFNYVKKLHPEIFANGFPQYKIFYCGEYGTTTYRPHYHLLFLFDDENLCPSLSKFRDIVYDCWSLRVRLKHGFNKYKIRHFADRSRFSIEGETSPGERPNFSFIEITDSAAVASYVSSYVCGTSSIPKVLRYKSWSAKLIVPKGKYGYFGSGPHDCEEIMQKVVEMSARPSSIAHYGSSFVKTTQRYNEKQQSFELVTVPYSRACIRALFCKPFGYNKIPHHLVKSAFEGVFTQVCAKFRKLKKLGFPFSFKDFLYSNFFRPFVLDLVETSPFLQYYYRLGVIRESFWLFLRNGFRTMFEFHLDVTTYLRLFDFVHLILIPQCRLYQFYTEQDNLLRAGCDVTCMYDDVSSAPSIWFDSFPKYRYPKSLILSGIRRRFDDIKFNHLKHHIRSNIV